MLNSYIVLTGRSHTSSENISFPLESIIIIELMLRLKFAKSTKQISSSVSKKNTSASADVVKLLILIFPSSVAVCALEWKAQIEIITTNRYLLTFMVK